MYYLLNPRKKPPAKGKKKSGSSTRRGTRRAGTKAKPTKRRRKKSSSGGAAMRKTKKRRRKAPVRRRRKARKNPVRRKRRKATSRRKAPVRRRRKARKAPVRRRKARKATRRRAYRRNPIRRRKARKARKATKKRRSPGRARRRVKMGLGNFLPSLAEFRSTAITGVQVMGGWATAAAIVNVLKNPIGSFFATLNLPEVDEAGKMALPRWLAWQAIDVTVAFAAAGIVGAATGNKDLRNKFLLGGMLRVVWHAGKYFLPAEAQAYVLHGPSAPPGLGAPGMADWITKADTTPGIAGGLPSGGLGDYITRRSLGGGSYSNAAGGVGMMGY